MATGAAVAVVVGTGLTIAAKRKQAKAEARAARENAANKRIQALELLDRFEINKEALLLEGEVFKGTQKVGFAGKG